MIKINKKIIIIVGIIILAVGGYFIIDRYTGDQLLKHAMRTKFDDHKEFLGLEFSNIKRIKDTKNQQSNTIKFVVENTNKKKHPEDHLVLYFVNDKGKIFDVLGFIVPELEPGEKIKLEFIVNDKIYNCRNFFVDKQ